MSNGFSIQNMPVSYVSLDSSMVTSKSLLIHECRSAIIFPLDKQVIIHDGEIEVKGWSYSGGGNWVERVEISPDGYTCPHGVHVPGLTQLE